MSYESISVAKDGTNIPIFSSGQAMYSKYAPLRDAEKFVETEENNQSGFYLVCGIGSGIHIQSLRKKFPDVKIVAVEFSPKDIDFLDKHFKIKNLANSHSFQIATIENLKKIFLSTYNPILDGDFKFLPLRSWVNNNNKEFEVIKETIQQGLDEIASDISTQAHFGKIWHRNILQNLIFLGNNDIKTKLPKTENFQGAVIVAPGPSINQSIEYLEKSNKYIIATDTALPILLKRKIPIHAVVTIDAQIVSRQHFLCKIPKDILLIADLCANPATVKKFHNIGASILFVRNNHPLCNLINEYFSNFNLNLSFLYSGAGTVTISALDFAIKTGFTNIEILGADFSYLKTCAYGKGSYFEDRFDNKSNRLDSSEKKNLDLFFRQPLKEIGKDTFATNNLIAYKKSLEEYIFQMKGIFTSNSNNKINSYTFQKTKFEPFNIFNPNKQQVDSFFSWYIDGLEKHTDWAKVSILPLMAWNNKKNSKKMSFFSLVKLAYYQTVGYTSKHGK